MDIACHDPLRIHPELGALPRKTVISALRDQIRWIERRPPVLDEKMVRGEKPAGSFPPHSRMAGAAAWRTGCGPIDAYLGPGGLETDAVHEIKPIDVAAGDPASVPVAQAAARSAAFCFMLALAARRLNAGTGSTAFAMQPDILICGLEADEREFGRLYGPGLTGFGIDPARVMVVSAKRSDDVLWVLEEGLRARALKLVIGQLADVALTPARRLSLAAAETSTSCLLMTHGRTSSTGATASRWRIAPSSSAPHPLAANAPGALRLAASLERCRAHPPLLAGRDFVLEWCDEAFRFRLADEFCHRASAPRLSWGPRDRGGWRERA